MHDLRRIKIPRFHNRNWAFVYKKSEVNKELLHPKVGQKVVVVGFEKFEVIENALLKSCHPHMRQVFKE